jgi:hypothetical protein
MVAAVTFALLLLAMIALRLAGRQGKGKKPIQTAPPYRKHEEQQEHMEEYKETLALQAEKLISTAREDIENHRKRTMEELLRTEEAEKRILAIFEREYAELQEKPASMSISFQGDFVYMLPPEEDNLHKAVFRIDLDPEDSPDNILSFALIRYPHTEEEYENCEAFEHVPVRSMPETAAKLADFLEKNPGMIEFELEDV